MGDVAGSAVSEQSSDTDLASALATGDQQAFAQLYDRYSDRIFSYCVSVCKSPDLAADAMQDSFLLAFARIGQLRDTSKLRPWLYAIARNECLRQIRANKRTVDLEQAGEVADVNTNLDVDLNAEDARGLIDGAFAGMNSSDREVLDLALRQDLDNSAVAAVLGVSDNNAAAKISRAKSQLEKAVGALMLFRGRSGGCGQLDTEIGPDKAFTPLARKRISRHAEDCATCSKSRSKSIAAIALAGLPILAAPSVVREALFNSAVPSTGGATTASGIDAVPDATTQVADSSGGSSATDAGDGGQPSDSGQAATDAGHGGDAAGDLTNQPDAGAHPSPESLTPKADGPVYIAQTQGKFPPLPLKDKAAKLDKARPAFDKNGWPLAGGKPPKRWPLVAAIAAVAVLMSAAAGVAIVGEAEVPAAGQTQISVPPIAVPSGTPPTTTSAPAKKKAPAPTSASASASASSSGSSGSSSSGSGQGSSKPPSKPKPKPKPTTPTPPAPGPTPGGPGGAPGGPGAIAAPPAPIPG